MIKRAILWGLLFGLFIGCGSGDELERVVVSGNVSYNEVPILTGRLTLFPIKGTKGPSAGAEIREGKYRIDAKGGVPLGTYRVEFNGWQVPDPPPRELPPPVPEDFLPVKFNAESTIEFTAEPGEPMTKDYDLEDE